MCRAFRIHILAARLPGIKSVRKKNKKNNGFIQPIISIDGLCYKNGVIDSTCICFYECLHERLTCNREKTAEMRWVKKMEQKLVALQLRLSYNIS